MLLSPELRKAWPDITYFSNSFSNSGCKMHRFDMLIHCNLKTSNATMTFAEDPEHSMFFVIASLSYPDGSGMSYPDASEISFDSFEY